MKKDDRILLNIGEDLEDYEGTRIETTYSFTSREAMVAKAKEIMNGAEYPEIITDTWNKIQIDVSGFSMNTEEIVTCKWNPVISDTDNNAPDVVTITKNIGASVSGLPTFTYGRKIEFALQTEEVQVVIPDGWELYKSFSGEYKITSPEGVDYVFENVLFSVNDDPAFRYRTKNGKTFIIPLEKVEHEEEF